jgi:hypothetical protein
LHDLAMGDSRGEIVGAVIMILFGAGNLALGNPVLGGVGLVFGLAGLGVILGRRRGWITPRPRTTSRSVRIRPPASPDPAPVADRAVPQLSEPGRERVAEIVATLHAAGVFAPMAPDPTVLHEPVADYGEPVTTDAVLLALGEASYYHPGFRPESCTANLVCHGSQTEQFEDYLREQIDDLVRLAGGALTVTVTGIEQEWTDGSHQVPTRFRWSVNGAEQTLAYTGAGKYLSTMIHVTLARAMAGAPRRLASLWGDQCMWITALPVGGVERLNATLGLDAAADSRWEWVDDQEPLAAGDV